MTCRGVFSVHSHANGCARTDLAEIPTRLPVFLCAFLPTIVYFLL